VARKLVIGNWKMNGNLGANTALVADIVGAASSFGEVQVVLCPPTAYLGQIAESVKGSPVKLGAQNVSAYAAGAYTGEVSAAMLADFGCQFVLIGHSERRALFGESDAVVAQKIQQAIANQLTPVICVGETLQEREDGQVGSVINRQLQAALGALNPSVQFVLAYEPVWAIGTGKTASAEQAQEVHALIRNGLVGSGFNAGEVSILYGGSVKASNAAGLFAQSDIDGGLIGGAALVATEFNAICAAAR
jgi:triosephosphate isomerase (TIM)